MNTTTLWQSLRLLLAAFVAVAFCCQCESVRTVKSTRSTGYKFAGHNDHELEGKKKGQGATRIGDSLKNERVIKNSDGEVVRVEKKGGLYSGETFEAGQKLNKSFTKQTNLRTNKDASKQFKTPEYLKMQKYSQTKSFKDGALQARESGSESKLFANRLFKTKSDKSSNLQARENDSNASGFQKVLKSPSDTKTARALKKAPNPEGVGANIGYQDNLRLTMDDVKKMVNPSSYRPNG